jgi:hypothetical protein
MVDIRRSACTWLTLQDQHVHGWPYKISTYMVGNMHVLIKSTYVKLLFNEPVFIWFWHDKEVNHVRAGLVRSTMYVLVLISTYMVDFTRSAHTWLTLQEHHVHGWPYKISTYMVDLTRSTSTWLGLQGKVNNVRAALVRSTMYVLLL